MKKITPFVLLRLTLCGLLLTTCLEMQARKFVHPGILHTTQSIKRMRTQIANKEYPAYGSFELLKNHHCSQADYRPFGPFEVISRDGEFRHTKPKMEQDFSAVYQNALMWALTGEETHAEKSLNLLLGYAETLKRIPETNDAPLLVGLEGLKIIYATEMLRHTYKKITTAQFQQISQMIKEVFLPVMENFYNRKPYTNGNWGPIVTKAYLAAAILWDNEEMYDKAIRFYLHANDNGTIAHYVSGETGQIQESGRDQGHSMLGIGALATVCEIAWQQGDDLYSALDNRLLKGFEYVAKYNLGYEVPFTTWKDVTGKYSNWTQISDKGRGRFMPVFEMAYNHYVNRKGLQMPYTEKVLMKIRPEGYDRDQPAFGSLLFNEAKPRKNCVDLVNPFVDSHRSRWFFFSSACRPFGMVSLSPDTDTEHSSLSEWNDWLGRIEVEGGTREQQIKMYTDLWHALLGHRVVSDADGHYMDMTTDYPRIRQIPSGEDGRPLYNHHNFDAWCGSHWSLNILWSMAYPEVMNDFCNTMVDMYRNALWLTQKWVRKVKAAYGDITPYGSYRDDEDQGQMGALGVLMAIGLFEVDGGCAERPFYEITSPVFSKVTIHLDNRYYPGNTFEIIARGNSDKNMYIQSATLNGEKWDKCWFYHDDFVKGGRLELKLGARPNKKWGSKELPPSWKLEK